MPLGRPEMQKNPKEKENGITRNQRGETLNAKPKSYVTIISPRFRTQRQVLCQMTRLLYPAGVMNAGSLAFKERWSQPVSCSERRIIRSRGMSACYSPISCRCLLTVNNIKELQVNSHVSVINSPLLLAFRSSSSQPGISS